MNKNWQTFVFTFKREKHLFLLNLLVLTMTFLVLSVFIYVVVISQSALKTLESQAQITVFFKDDFATEEINKFKDTLSEDPRIKSIKYVSKEDAFKIFSRLNKDEPLLLESISSNILPASFEINTVKLSQLKSLALELKSKDGIEDVKYFEGVIERFRVWSSVFYIVGSALALLFFIISYSVILVTIRTTIHSKGKELEIQRLVGASNSYLKSPLVFQGVMLGFISSIMAGVLVIISTALLLYFKVNIFSKLLTFSLFLLQVNLPIYLFTVILFAILVLSGILIGYLGSLSAVKKYLKY